MQLTAPRAREAATARAARWVAALVVAQAVTGLATAASAQQPAAACFPACRPGFACSKGRCVSPCNPPCGAAETCSAQGECVEGPAPSPAPAPPAPPATVPAAAASQRRVAPGETGACLAANEAAMSLERTHALRAARTQLIACAAPGCPPDVRSECVRRLADVGSAIPTVVFEVRGPSGAEATDVKVTMDGEPLAQHLDGSALALDPGEHAFTFELEGAPVLRKQIVVHEGDHNHHETVAFAVVAADSPPPAAEAPAPPGPAHAGSAVRTVGWVVAGAGAVALGIAGYYQLTALSRASDSTSAAGSSDPSVQVTAGAIHDQAAQAQTYAIVSGAVGAAALGAGLVVVLTARSDPPPQQAAARWHLVPELGATGGGLAAVAAW